MGKIVRNLVPLLWMENATGFRVVSILIITSWFEKLRSKNYPLLYSLNPNSILAEYDNNWIFRAADARCSQGSKLSYNLWPHMTPKLPQSVGASIERVQISNPSYRRGFQTRTRKCVKYCQVPFNAVAGK